MYDTSIRICAKFFLTQDVGEYLVPRNQLASHGPFTISCSEPVNEEQSIRRTIKLSLTGRVSLAK